MKTMTNTSLILLFLAAFPSIVFSQSTVQESDSSRTKVILDENNKMPIFPGECELISDLQEQARCTESNLIFFLLNNAPYPEEARNNGLRGRVFVEFTINKTGEAEDIKIIKSIHPTLDSSAINAVRLLPTLIPAVQNGKPVKSKYTIPINFNLAGNSDFKVPEKAFTYGLVIDPENNLDQTLKDKYTLPKQLPIIESECSEMSTISQKECMETVLIKQIQKNIEYPKAAVKDGIEGVVYYKFSIDSSGKTTFIKLVKGDHPILNNAAKKAIKKLPKFKAARTSKNVYFTYIVPVTFKL